MVHRHRASSSTVLETRVVTATVLTNKRRTQEEIIAASQSHKRQAVRGGDCERVMSSLAHHTQSKEWSSALEEFEKGLDNILLLKSNCEREVYDQVTYLNTLIPFTRI